MVIRAQKIILPIRPRIQKTNWDCGPASLAIVLDTLGRRADLKTLARLARSDRNGTSPQNLARALQSLGVRHKVFKRATKKLMADKIAARHLCVVDYQAWARGGADILREASGHYSVVFGFNKTHFFLADPSRVRVKNLARRGLRTIRKDLFEKRWHDRGPNSKTFHWMLCVPILKK